MGREGRELDLSGARHSTGMWLGKVTSGSEEEDNIIGPMPAKGPVESDVTKEFEHRAQRMKEKLTSADSPVPRQSWMTELPPGLKNIGFGPRTVRRGADDKSGIGSIWTDTPADRERKAKKVTDSEEEDHHYLWIMKKLCYLEETRDLLSRWLPTMSPRDQNLS
ncbi:GPALPP motifs-containing protein 1 isoform X1 [Anas acuta]|uniref:GPALPP motifs-containing protein 1 isoform X1 n=2 Tax=Anas acuta TaxID=28680 RepID=UPI0035C8DA64